MKKMKTVIRAILFTVCFGSFVFADSFSIDTDRFKTNPFYDRYFSVYGGSGLDAGLIDFNFIMKYQPEALTTFDKDGNVIRSVISNQFLADLSFAYSPVKWFDIGLVFPLVIFQNGEGWDENDSVPSGGIGDIRLVPRFQLVNVRDGLFALSVITELSAPTGKLIHSALGSSQFVFKPSIALGSDSRRVGFAANLFYQILEKQVYAGSIFDDEFGAKAALNIHAIPDLFDIVGEFIASTSISDPFDNKAVDNIELGGGLKIKTPVDLDVFAGAYGGFGSAVGVPKYRVFLGISWNMNVSKKKIAELPAQTVEPKAEPKVEPKPEPKVEPKPEPKVEPKPEPKVEPKPEPKVESKPEPKVEPKQVVKSGERLQSVIRFQHGSDYIQEAIEIEKVAMILSRNFTLKIRIEGHNDITENAKLSQKRADAVKAVLIKNGVEAGRIITKAIGASEPVAKGDTDIDLEKNRRVEFFIVNN